MKIYYLIAKLANEEANKMIKPIFQTPVKNVKKIVIVLSFFLFFAVSSYCFEVNLKISGALCYLNPEHVNRSLHGWEEWFKKGGPKGWSYKEGKVKDLHSGISFEGEFIISFTRRFAAGFGTGYIYSELSEEKTAITIDRSKETFIFVRPIKINAFPLNLSAYYFFPLSEKMKLFIRGGTGIVWAKYVERQGRAESLEDEFNYNWKQEATAQGQAYFTSLGLIYEPDPFFRFFIEGEAKLAKLSGFHGETEEGENGTLFFFEEYNPNLKFWAAQNVLLKEEPSGDNFRSIQETVMDLSGFSIKIGILIKF